ncbi:hypothetical protein B5X24_HaOG208498 [Helicoverpa armigera]|uniref:Endonuclease/exonuclease/phosphatase domain-containing protein n=1 Tax=Helicoverpa armigera TaxID=29058 RepID=A0A2W1BM28_HELAM|nr:hypothetical protein B5X24_HaOG208498 [Helicoverpa armigera]
MEAVRSKSSKLNKDEIAAIGSHTERLSAVVTHLTLRLAAAERAAQRLPVAEPAAPTPLSFADALRLGKTTAPVPIVPPPGPAVAIYPAEDQRGVIKTANDTRRTLLDAVHPGRLGLQIAGVRKIAQLNLQGSALATTELPAVSKAMGVHIVLAQESYCGSSAPSLTLPECSAPKVGIYVADRTTTCAVLQHLSTPHCLVCHILIGGLSMYMVSAYFQYSEDISPHLEHLARVLNTLRGCRVLVGADTNTHSPLWHSEQRHYIGRGGETTRRREAMEDFIMAHDLILHNVGNQPPTFATVNGESNIDVHTWRPASHWKKTSWWKYIIRREAQGSRHSARGTRSEAQGARLRARGTGREALGARNTTRGTGREAQGTRHSERGTHHSERGTHHSERGRRAVLACRQRAAAQPCEITRSEIRGSSQQQEAERRC